MLRADLHVHTCHSKVSGNAAVSRQPRLLLVARRCLPRREGARHGSRRHHRSRLDRRRARTARSRVPDAADIIVGEEVSCWFPDAGIQVHLGVYGMTEALHRELQPLRGNAFEVAACLREAGVFFALNHLLHFYRGQMPFDAYLRLLDEVPALEARTARWCRRTTCWSSALAEPIGLAVGRFGMIGGQRRAHAAARRPDLDGGAGPRRATNSWRAFAKARPSGRCARRGRVVAGDAYGVDRIVRRGARRASGRAISVAGGAPPVWRSPSCRSPVQFVPLAGRAGRQAREATRSASAPRAHFDRACRRSPDDRWPQESEA